MSSGWICLHRSIQDHWVFQRDDYFRAWSIMIMAANHRDNKTLIKGKLLSCKRGESVMSHQTWADKFGKGWNRSKVIRFFKLLENDHMIVQVNEQVTTRVTICNYSKFQDQLINSEQVSEQETEQVTVQQTNRTRTGDGTQLNNDNKVNNKTSKARARFVKPTLEEIRAYCTQENLSVDCEYFFNHYESNGWKVGRNPMKNWQLTMKNWHSRDSKKPQQVSGGNVNTAVNWATQ